MKRRLELLKNSPEEFVRRILHAEPDGWQEEALKSLAKYPRVAIRSGHGVGKSCMISWAILWFLTTRSYPKVIATAPTIRQLYDVLWSELAKWLKRSPILTTLFDWQKTKILLRSDPERWFAVARTAAKPENLAGFHERSILFVLDEASGISDEIFEAVQGALTTTDAKLLLCGNPTRTVGFFKRAFFEDRERYRVMKVSSAESGRVSEGYCAELMSTYGADSDVVRVRVLGEFPTGASDCLINLEYIESAMSREKLPKGDMIFGADIARQGSDMTVIATRVGDNLLTLKKWRSSDLMSTCGRIVGEVMARLEEYGMQRAELRIDDDGLGAGVTDRLREVMREKNLNVRVVACHNGGKSYDQKYGNFVTECYFGLRERLQEGTITLPRDDQLAAELSMRKFTVTSSDKIVLERKEEFKRRLKRSPDSADAVALAYAPKMSISAPPVTNTLRSYWR